jgi:hypothetical protein
MEISLLTRLRYWNRFTCMEALTFMLKIFDIFGS